MSRRKTTEEFIKEATLLYGDKYSYDKTVYIDSNTKVIITCKKHGDFSMTPLNFLRGHECPKCSGKYRWTTKEWINEAKKIHGDKYDYSNSKYINCTTKIKINCPKHGVFEKYPGDHINGGGCKKCAMEERSKKYFTMTTEEFIEKARKVHGDKYDYSLVKYTGCRNDIEIICPKHGIFKQIPYMHLYGHGCPKCQQSSLERELELELHDKEIIFKEQQKFDWLGKMSLDFYLPNYNTAIECQGEQHYISKLFFGGDVEFEKVKERDERKKRLCEENGVRLLYYTRYKDVQEDNKTIFKDKDILLSAIKGEQ